MVGRLSFVIALLLALVAVAQEDEEAPSPIRYRFALDHDVIYNNVEGPGEKQSNLNEGWHYFTVLNTDLEGELYDLDVNLSIGLKATDDGTRDTRDLSLTTLRGTISGEHVIVNLGDTFESFSQYSLSSAIKGGSVRFMPFGEGNTTLIGVYGIAYPRWDSWLDDGWTDAVRREVKGFRLEQPVFDKLMRLGLSAVRSDDSDPVLVGDTLYDNDVYAADLDWEIIDGLNLNVESAYGDTHQWIENGASSDYNGTAHRIELVGNGGPSRVQLEYERISPNFWTSMGSAVADREKYKARWRYRVVRDVTVTTGYLYYHDNLNGQRGIRTDHHKPDIAATWSRPFARRYAAIDARYKQDWTRNRDRDTLDHYLTLGYRDRFGMVDMDTNVGYTAYDTNAANAARRRDADEYTYNTTLSSRHTVGEFILKPQLYLGGWNSRDELANESTQIWEDSVGLGVEVPSVNLSSDVRVGQHRLHSSDHPTAESTRSFGRLNIYYRPESWQRIGRAMVTLELAYNDLDFNVIDRDYSEFSSLLGVRLEF